jgi:hypothetical protein
MPVILATQEADIRRFTVWSQPEQIVRETLESKPSQKAGEVAQGVGPEFKPQYRQKKWMQVTAGIFNSSAQKAEARRSWVWAQAGLNSETLSQKEKCAGEQC